MGLIHIVTSSSSNKPEKHRTPEQEKKDAEHAINWFILMVAVIVLTVAVLICEHYL